MTLSPWPSVVKVSCVVMASFTGTAMLDLAPRLCSVIKHSEMEWRHATIYSDSLSSNSIFHMENTIEMTLFPLLTFRLIPCNPKVLIYPLLAPM